MQCIASANENNERTRKIQEDIKTVTMEQLVEEAGKRNALCRRLGDKIADSISEEDVAAVMKILEMKKSKKEQYISCLKSFGRENGRRIYRIIREI